MHNQFQTDLLLFRLRTAKNYLNLLTDGNSLQ